MEAHRKWPIRMAGLFVPNFFNVALSLTETWIRVTKGPCVSFTNILSAAFTHADFKSAKKTVTSSSFLRFWDL